MNPDTYDPRRLLDQLEAHVAKAKESAAALAAVEGWGEAANGHVKVCVGPSGMLKKVELDPRAMRMPSEDLATSIVDAAQEAQRAAAASIREIYSPMDTGGIDIAAVAQGEYDASADVEQRLAKAREAMRDVR
jgi:DNA-binding protein YbaB